MSTNEQQDQGGRTEKSAAPNQQQAPGLPQSESVALRDAYVARLEKALHKAFKLSALDFKHADARGVLAKVHTTLAPIGIEITAKKRRTEGT